MKFELIDRAYNIVDFENQANELVYYLNKRVLSLGNGGQDDRMKEQKQLIHYGFKVVLDVIEQYPVLLQPTLLTTMLKVKRELADLSKRTKEYENINAVSLAINHIQQWMTVDNELSKYADYEADYKEKQQDEKHAKLLATEIKKMLSPANLKKNKSIKNPVHKAIWALKVNKKDKALGEPFIAGYKRNDVVTKLNMSTSTVSTGLNKGWAVKGYKLWYE